MIIYQEFDAILAGVSSKKSKDGTKEYYNLTVEINDEYATIMTDKSVFDGYKSGKFPKYSMQRFVSEFNPQYGSYRVSGIVANESQKK